MMLVSQVVLILIGLGRIISERQGTAARRLFGEPDVARSARAAASSAARHAAVWRRRQRVRTASSDERGSEGHGLTLSQGG